jgi:hypothetical protein
MGAQALCKFSQAQAKPRFTAITLIRYAGYWRRHNY